MRAHIKIQALILLMAFLFPVSFVFAQETTSESEETAEIAALLEQISALLAVVEALQAQLAILNGGGTISTEFTRNLSIGDEGIEVRALQQMLNDDPRTRIASTGPGSPGQESTYFGALTANAVARFQELYASEILVPAGLTRGSGFFGPGTRAKMNALINSGVKMTISNTANTPNSNNSVSTTQNTTNNQNSDVNSESTNSQNSLDLSALSNNSVNTSIVNTVTTDSNGGPSLSLPSLQYEVYDGFSVGEATSYAGAPGESITIKGTNLTNGTNIHFGLGTSINGTASSDGTSLSFVIPNITRGPYELTFSSESAEEALRIMDFAITLENATAPEIFSVSPSIGPEGTPITIYGSGFTPTNNQVEFGQTIVEGVPSSDGKSLKLNVIAGVDLPSASETAGLSYAEWPVFIYIANANGRALEPSVFIIKN